MVNVNDYSPTLHSDISIYTEDVYKEHKAFIANEQYQEAVELLSNHTDLSAPTAIVLNGWEERIVELEEIIGTGDQLDYIVNSESEPDVNTYEGMTIWVKPIS